MNANPLIFSGSHPANEGWEYNIWPPLFGEASSSLHNDLFLEDFDFPDSEPPAKYIDDPNGLERAGKKLLHKAMERERRKDMRSRISALRSLLPDENVRGKASTIDQLSEAADYIRRLQLKVEELASKRERMEKMSFNKKQKVYNALPCNESEGFPLVNLSLLGSRLVIAINALRGRIVLSKLLLAVEEGGLQVLTATSLVAGDKVFYTVHCKVFEVESFTSGTELRQKLLRLIG